MLTELFCSKQLYHQGYSALSRIQVVTKLDLDSHMAFQPHPLRRRKGARLPSGWKNLDLSAYKDGNSSTPKIRKIDEELRLARERIDELEASLVEAISEESKRIYQEMPPELQAEHQRVRPWYWAQNTSQDISRDRDRTGQGVGPVTGTNEIDWIRGPIDTL
jgi:hypothetical protein